jgi:hypothetical protein
MMETSSVFFDSEPYGQGSFYPSAQTALSGAVAPYASSVYYPPGQGQPKGGYGGNEGYAYY